MLASSEVDNAHLLGFYRELMPALEGIGRDDLTRVIQAKIAAFERSRTWHADESFRGAPRRLDRRYLRGAVLRLATRLGRS